ncbi:MAG: NADP-dependent oxidoreductase [Moraxellaceae bacterium]|nr:MAG: NADP-dependent oxidoreductase [Moraxellaceae bacterium]
MTSTTEHKNQRIVLAARPVGEPKHSDFRIEDIDIPALKDGEMLLKTVYLSLDPYMRGRMSDAPSYAAPVEIGEVMVGGTVSQVIESKNPKFKPGEWVLSGNGWQSYSVSDGKQCQSLGMNPEHPSWALGILGMPGFTAYMGLLDIGQPKAGETLVVAAATGPVGATVGQIAKIKGCRVVGVAGGAEKCRYAVEELGFDACIDHHDENFVEKLKQAVPDGIDIYYENVGGKVFDAVWPLLNSAARIPLCGVVSQYNATEQAQGSDRLPGFIGTLLKKRIRIQGFIIFDDYGSHYPEFNQQMSTWLKEGKIKYKENVIAGLDKTVDAFNGMLKGENFGKTVIKV